MAALADWIGPTRSCCCCGSAGASLANGGAGTFWLACGCGWNLSLLASCCCCCCSFDAVVVDVFTLASNPLESFSFVSIPAGTIWALTSCVKLANLFEGSWNNDGRPLVERLLAKNGRKRCGGIIKLFCCSLFEDGWLFLELI